MGLPDLVWNGLLSMHGRPDNRTDVAQHFNLPVLIEVMLYYTATRRLYHVACSESLSIPANQL